MLSGCTTLSLLLGLKWLTRAPIKGGTPTSSIRGDESTSKGLKCGCFEVKVEYLNLNIITRGSHAILNYF